ncbi:lipopolysaccharide assembly protein LapA domain-containing protein [Falsiroseomonas selenitidurans]|uniref:LapA family protein n=1 Tax=Falsiroseomonas selenitidurans TaxID=2716335 RepID=A0ABX1E980_9PROT|nr:lipopolysaccharide assembly protein LapA domain-containing protein [Falsiroseomonas selenitidurans]NKC32322.1 LapA family protein [Falsiroseomonas selenitidurans]
MRWLLFLPLLILLAVFALSNMQEVQFRLWPFDLAWAAPLGVAALILSGFGFVIGALIAWAAGLPARRRARRVEEAARLVESELAVLKAREAALRDAPGPAPMRISLRSGA